MPRRARNATSGLIFHIVNRGSRKGPLFESDADYQAFEKLLVAAICRGDVVLFAYCLMPNHWHFVVAPRTDAALSRFMHWLTTTHACRWHLSRGTGGQGAVYQGRFKAIPIAADQHFLWVCRYVERNALRRSLVTRAEDWPWSSLWQRERNAAGATWLAPWPVARPDDWAEYVNVPQTVAELEAFRAASLRDEPFGDPAWRKEVMTRMGRVRDRTPGRPPKRTPDPITDL